MDKIVYKYSKISQEYPPVDEQYLFDTKDGAEKKACADILSDIGADWDLTDPATLASAKKINELVKDGKYEEAIDEMNEEASEWDNMYFT